MKIEETALVLFEAARTEWGAHGKPVPPHQMEQILLLSQAESLKRIADRLVEFDLTPFANQLLDIAYQAGENFRNAA